MYDHTTETHAHVRIHSLESEQGNTEHTKHTRAINSVIRWSCLRVLFAYVWNKHLSL